MTHFYYYCFLLSNKTMRIVKTFLNENKEIKEQFTKSYDGTNFDIYYDPYSDQAHSDDDGEEERYLENNDTDVYIECFSSWEQCDAIVKVYEFIKENAKEEEYWIDSIFEGSFKANPIGKKSPVSLICSKYIVGGKGSYESYELKYFFN